MANEPKNSVLAEVREFVAEYHGVSVEVVTPETDLDETLEGKSREEIDWWEFVYYLGKKHNIEIPAEAVGTVGEVAKYIEKHRSKNSRML